MPSLRRVGAGLVEAGAAVARAVMDEVTEIRESLEAHPRLAGRQIEVWKEAASGNICVRVSVDGQEVGCRFSASVRRLVTPTAIASMFAKAIANTDGGPTTTPPG